MVGRATSEQRRREEAGRSRRGWRLAGVCLASIALLLWLASTQEPVVTRLALNWPGGPWSLLMSAALLAPTMFIVVCLVYGLRLQNAIRAGLGKALCTVLALASIVSAVPMVLAAPPGKRGSESEFRQVIADVAPGAATWSFVAAFGVLLVWGALFTRVLRWAARSLTGR